MRLSKSRQIIQVGFKWASSTQDICFYVESEALISLLNTKNDNVDIDFELSFISGFSKTRGFVWLEWGTYKPFKGNNDTMIHSLKQGFVSVLLST